MQIKFYLPVILFVILSACSPRLTPFTQGLYDQYEWTENDLKNVQFYLSDNVRLTRRLQGGQAEIINGEVKIVNGERVEEVIIPKGTPGALLFIPKENRFAIGFESDTDQYLMFGPNPKVGNRYVLLAAEWNRRSGKVTYGGVTYTTTDQSALSTLLIDLKRVNDISRNTRVARGRTIK